MNEPDKYDLCVKWAYKYNEYKFQKEKLNKIAYIKKISNTNPIIILPSYKNLVKKCL